MYLASYIDMNAASLDYFKQQRNCVHLNQFCQETLRICTYNQEFQRELRSSYDSYAAQVALSLSSDTCLEKLLAHKKLFCPFWLLEPINCLFEP